MSAYVYKYVCNGEIVYIGIAKDLNARLFQHGRPGDNIKPEFWSELNASEVSYAKFPNRNAAEFVESALIRKYMPQANVAKKSEDFSPIEIGEPEWILWEPPEKEAGKGRRKRRTFAEKEEPRKARLEKRFPNAIEVTQPINTQTLMDSIFFFVAR